MRLPKIDAIRTSVVANSGLTEGSPALAKNYQTQPQQATASSYIPQQKFCSFQDKPQSFIKKLRENAKVSSAHTKQMHVRIASANKVAKQ